MIEFVTLEPCECCGTKDKWKFFGFSNEMGEEREDYYKCYGENCDNEAMIIKNKINQLFCKPEGEIK